MHVNCCSLNLHIRYDVAGLQLSQFFLSVYFPLGIDFEGPDEVEIQRLEVCVFIFFGPDRNLHCHSYCKPPYYAV